MNEEETRAHAFGVAARSNGAPCDPRMDAEFREWANVARPETVERVALARHWRAGWELQDARERERPPGEADQDREQRARDRARVMGGGSRRLGRKNDPAEDKVFLRWLAGAHDGDFGASAAWSARDRLLADWRQGWELCDQSIRARPPSPRLIDSIHGRELVNQAVAVFAECATFTDQSDGREVLRLLRSKIDELLAEEDDLGLIPAAARRPDLREGGADIFDRVLLAMQPAEEMGGPEGEHYAALMQAIALESVGRLAAAARGESAMQRLADNQHSEA